MIRKVAYLLESGSTEQIIGVRKLDQLIDSFDKVAERSKGKGFAFYPNGFPPEVIASFKVKIMWTKFST